MDSPGLACLQACAAALKTAVFADVTTPPLMHLAKAPFTPGPGLDPATLTEADFDGYNHKDIGAWGTVHQNPAGQWTFTATSALAWTPTGAVTPNTIYGWWWTDKFGNVAASGLLPTPVTLNGTGTTLALVPGVGMAPWAFTTPVLP